MTQQQAPHAAPEDESEPPALAAIATGQPAGGPGRRARLWLLALLVIAGIGGCVAGVGAFFREDLNAAQHIAAFQQPPAHRLDVRATVLSIDPARNQMRLALEFTPRGNLLEANGHDLARDVHLSTDSAQGAALLTLHRHHQPHPIEVALSLEDGDIAQYPIDRYRASLQLEAWVGAGDDDEEPVPLALTLVARNHALRVDASLGAGSEPHELNVDLVLARPPAVQAFAWFINGLMVMLALSSIIVVYNVAWRGKKLEPNLLVWMSALLFVLPTMRNTLPGVPPLGSLTDFLVFFWVEAVLALCLFLMVLTWYGRVPDR